MQPLPSYIQIEPVGQCNLRCTMCPIQFRHDGPPYGPLAFMAWDTYTRIVDEFTTLEKIHLQGLGEPMMHPRYFDMVEYAASRGIQVTTNSNLHLLNPGRAQSCVESGLDVLHVSVDGATPEVFDKIRVRGDLNKVIRNLELLLEARQKAASATPHLHMVMVIMRQNLHELPDLVRFAHQWQMEELFVQHLAHDFQESTLPAEYLPMRQYVTEQTLLNEDIGRINHYYGEARAAAEALNVVLRLPRPRPHLHPEGTPGRQRCDWPWTGMYISYDGYVMPCCMTATPDRINFGNIREQGVEAVWNSEALEAFRGQLDSDDAPEVCKSCSIYSSTF